VCRAQRALPRRAHRGHELSFEESLRAAPDPVSAYLLSGSVSMGDAQRFKSTCDDGNGGGAALPVLLALGTVQNAGQLIDSANDVLKTKSIFISTPSGSVIPIPKGYEAFVAESGEGIVFKPSNRNSLPNPRNGNSIRVMDPGADPRYPNGYIRYTTNMDSPLTLVACLAARQPLITVSEVELACPASSTSSKTECRRNVW